MASNEIELTFIRCPSCKSLMPSTAHKCGMCGLNMEEEEAAPSEKKLRLRQRTNSDLSNVINSREADIEVSEEEYRNNVTAEMKFTPIAEPSYEEDLIQNDSEQYSEEDSAFHNPSEDEDDDTFEDESSDQDVVSEQANDGPVRKRKRRRRKKKKAPVMESTAEESLESNEKAENEVVVDSNWGSNLREEVAREEVAPQEDEQANKNLYRDFKFTEESVQAQPEMHEEKVVLQEPKIVPPVQVAEVRREIVANTNVRIGEKMNEGNKLLGWFVNYSTDENGKYFEIRNGKKFIGRQQLRPHDLLIPDSAISTPHCLLNAESGKLGLQDLMSDQGTFVKHAGENDFRRIDSTVMLKHGDILRLGTFELIVCLIPSS